MFCYARYYMDIICKYNYYEDLYCCTKILLYFYNKIKYTHLYL